MSRVVVVGVGWYSEVMLSVGFEYCRLALLQFSRSAAAVVLAVLLLVMQLCIVCPQPPWAMACTGRGARSEIDVVAGVDLLLHSVVIAPLYG
eukprot:Lankesteria_metandrocarpae@DN8792_c0_g1_i1.p1